VHELAELAAAGPRQYPIDIAKVNPPIALERAFRFELPAGWQATLPADVHASGPFGSYSVEFRQTGRQLTIRRVAEGSTGILGPDRLEDLREWFRALAKDDATAIVLTRGATQAGR